MPAKPKLLKWLRAACAEYGHDVAALYRVRGTNAWPLTAGDSAELAQKLRDGGHFLPLPKEPAALANILEVAIVDFLLAEIDATPGARASRGTERGYPDVEISGACFGDGYHAIDVKIAMRKRAARPGKTPARTQSRITLYTGNTYFLYPQLHWPGTFRPFADYQSHVDVIGIYTLNEHSTSRVDDLELIVQEPWAIASRQRSSTTREYIGAVMEIDRLREGRGEFANEDAFYKYWRAYKFKVGEAVKQQLQRLLKEQASR
ncbi:MAG: restriction endonuclease [Polyangiaceae bacterium UTPRO1]|jgi:hypothetical protein|nr:hypothetical protein [Myxococcales bacterium]OQY64956.1 MAG: restriction endonuclease [Polyangiaceae bacterium UTPRO1]